MVNKGGIVLPPPWRDICCPQEPPPPLPHLSGFLRVKGRPFPQHGHQNAGSDKHIVRRSGRNPYRPPLRTGHPSSLQLPRSPQLSRLSRRGHRSLLSNSSADQHLFSLILFHLFPYLQIGGCLLASSLKADAPPGVRTSIQISGFLFPFVYTTLPYSLRHRLRESAVAAPFIEKQHYAAPLLSFRRSRHSSALQSTLLPASASSSSVLFLIDASR